MKAGLILTLVGAVSAHVYGQDEQRGIYAPKQRARGTPEEMWAAGPQYAGVQSFAHFNTSKCLLHPELDYDIGIIGVPFDTATSYRPGARFGPSGIRSASQRQSQGRGYNPREGYNPYIDWATLVDCGDIPITSVSNEVALEQMTMAFEDLILRRHSSLNSTHPPRYVALGGDHAIILPHLRALRKMYGKIAVIHFDAHRDTSNPTRYGGYWSSEKTYFSHGSMLWMAHEEGLLSDNYNVHVGIRQIFSGKGPDDLLDDDSQGWIRFTADDVWDGAQSQMNTVVDVIHKRIPKDYPVYISLDVDCMDPGFAPGTGTIEPGGMTPREVIRLLRKLDLNLVGADVVELAPAYDHAEITATNAAQVVFEFLTSMVHKGKPLPTIRELEKD